MGKNYGIVKADISFGRPAGKGEFKGRKSGMHKKYGSRGPWVPEGYRGDSGGNGSS